MLKAEFGYVCEVQPMEGGNVHWGLAGYGSLDTNFELEPAITTARTIPHALLFQFRVDALSHPMMVFLRVTRC